MPLHQSGSGTLYGATGPRPFQNNLLHYHTTLATPLATPFANEDTGISGACWGRVLVRIRPGTPCEKGLEGVDEESMTLTRNWK